MAMVKCALGKRGRPSHEWNDGEKDRIYCLGWVDPMTDAPFPECVVCPDFVDKAQDDLEAFYGREERAGRSVFVIFAEKKYSRFRTLIESSWITTQTSTAQATRT